MQLLMFGGNSLKNRDWITEAEQHFKDQFSQTYVQQYRHWQTGEPMIDLGYESTALLAQVPKLEADYGIFAKSIGTVLAAQAIERGFLPPRFILFCGLPLGYILAEYPEFAGVLAAYNRPTTIIHNQADPVGSAQDAEAYMAIDAADIDHYQFIATPGNTHEYRDFALLKKELQTLVLVSGTIKE